MTIRIENLPQAAEAELSLADMSTIAGGFSVDFIKSIDGGACTAEFVYSDGLIG
ncbi:MAG: hypothetical protein HY319_26965 [Armatimonadetes bacterium]|nr:hypothetical protein [Armatimonadota bacterium]